MSRIRFIDRWLQTRTAETPVSDAERDLSALAAALFHSESSAQPAETPKAFGSPWKLEGRRRSLRTS